MLNDNGITDELIEEKIINVGTEEARDYISGLGIFKPANGKSVESFRTNFSKAKNTPSRN